MRLRRLDFLLKASEHGTFRKAAIALGVEQSIVSRQIKGLEDELGVSLFHRSPNGVVLTNAGQAYVEQARIALDHLSRAAEQAAAAGRAETGSVRIGLYSSLASGFLHTLIDNYAKRHPAISLELVEADCVELVNRLRKRELDVVFIAQDHQFDDCEVQWLWTERLIVCMSEGHMLALRDELDWPDFQQERFIVRSKGSGPQIVTSLAKIFAELDYSLEIEGHDVSREMLMDLVRIGKGITFVSEAALASTFQGVRMIPVENQTVDFHAVWMAGNDNPAFRRLLSLARKMSGPRFPSRS